MGRTAYEESTAFDHPPPQSSRVNSIIGQNQLTLLFKKPTIKFLLTTNRGKVGGITQICKHLSSTIYIPHSTKSETTPIISISQSLTSHHQANWLES